MTALILILLVNIGFTVLHTLSDFWAKYLPKGTKYNDRPLLVRVMTIENLHFGGKQMSDGKWWTIITATFEHNGYSHIVNNMIHFLGFASALETTIGGPALIAAYIVSGAAGWGLNYAFTRYHNRGEDWSSWKIFVTTCGSSPSTYALGIATALLVPGSAPMCETWGVPSWIWLWMLCCGPMVSGTRYNVQPWTKPARTVKDKPVAATPLLNWRFLRFISVTGCMTVLILRPLLKENSITGTMFFAIYLGKTLCFKFVDKVWRGTNFICFGSDHKCHLGGVLMTTLSACVISLATLLSASHIPTYGLLVLVTSHFPHLLCYLTFEPWVCERKHLHSAAISAAAFISCATCAWVLLALSEPWALDALLMVVTNNYLWLRLHLDF